MGLYSLTNEDNVVECKWNCEAKHEHYSGTYERAVKYFCVNQDEIKSYGRLLNMVIYHQTSGFTAVKLSNELYNILISKQADHKYWAAPNKRHENAMKVLEDARKINLIFDKGLCAKFEKSERKETNRRAYLYKLWAKQNEMEEV